MSSHGRGTAAVRIVAFAMIAVLVCIGIRQATLGHVEPGSAPTRDIVFATVDGEDLELDLYQPVAGAPKPYPLIIFVHGGAWQMGNKSSDSAIEYVLTLRQQGFAVASIDYRLAPKDTFPAQIEDVKAAVRFLRANADKYDLDPQRFGAAGSSAGGHLVALLGLSDETAGLEGTGGNPGVSSRVQAVLVMYGPSSFVGMSSATTSISLVSTLMGMSPEAPGAAEAYLRASPVTYASEDDPPFLILQGDKDDTVPPDQAVWLDEALRKVGVESNLVIVTNGSHGLYPVGGTMSPSAEELQQKVVEFFVKHLGRSS